MAVELADIRMAVIYVETILDVLTEELKDPPGAFLADRFSYAAKFDETMEARGGDVEPPWLDPSRSFWSYYFAGTDLEAVDGELASRSVTPFRHRFPLALDQPANARLGPEAFVYPHGVAVVFNLTLVGSRSLDDAAADLLALRLDKQYQISGGGGPIVLDALAEQALTALRRATFGDKVKQSSRSLASPFSIVSIARGDGVAPAAPLTQGGNEQLFLDAVTTWSRNWKNVTPKPLDKTTLPIRAAGTPASHVLYAHDRARAVWFPGFFSGRGFGAHTINCFHRNLLLASLQVESLAHFAVATAALPDGQLKGLHWEAARRATDVLGRFYGAARSIYRSRSPQAQMDQGGFVPDINAVRTAVQRPPLFA